MNREELAHILRAAAAITDAHDLLVIGSQAILGSFDDGSLPSEAIVSMEADVTFLSGSERNSDLVDGSIGEDSMFHESFGIYAQGVGLTTATLPIGWRERLVPFTSGDVGDGRPVCLERHDLAVSKLVAGREKDHRFVAALRRVRLLDDDVLFTRVAELPVDEAVRDRITGWLRATKPA